MEEMTRVNDLIRNRHTTRLMNDNISEDDVQTILDSARRAPSKNKIYGYKIFALTNSEKGTNLKQKLCDEITLYKEEDSTIYLMQTKAPLVLLYLTNPAPEHQMVGVKEELGTEVFDSAYSEVTSEIDRYAMIKSSVRDAMISVTYAQLTAEDLGYGTAFVACGLEDLPYQKDFQKLLAREFNIDFKDQLIEPVVMLCIGPKADKIKELYDGKEHTKAEYVESYLDGVTHYKRSGREESFFVNVKQENLIKTV